MTSLSIRDTILGIYTERDVNMADENRTGSLRVLCDDDDDGGDLCADAQKRGTGLVGGRKDIRSNLRSAKKKKSSDGVDL